MSRTTDARATRLLPVGVPRWIRVYDNGGETADRYTVVFTGRYRHLTGGEGWVLDMSAYPFHPQGVGMHSSYPGRSVDVNRWGFAPTIGRKNHLGRRIAFAELPEDCKRAVLQDYRELWSLNR